MKNIIKFSNFINRFYKNFQRNCSTKKLIDESIDEQFHFLPMGKSDLTMQTRVSFLSKDMNTEKLIGIRTISSTGFRLNNGHFMFGPIAVFPKTVFSWRVKKPEEITPTSLELFFLLQPKLDILIIGVGDQAAVDNVRKQILPALNKHKISYEILSTEFAISTFNFLNNDGRYVAAALFPPQDIIVKNYENGKVLHIVRDYFETDECPLFMGLNVTHNPIQDSVNKLFSDFTHEEREAAKKRVSEIREYNKEKTKKYFDNRFKNVEPERLKNEIKTQKQWELHLEKKKQIKSK